MTLHRRRHEEISDDRIRCLIQGYYQQAVAEADSINPVEVLAWPVSESTSRTAMDEMMGCLTKKARHRLAATYWARCQFLMNDVVTDGEV